MVIKEKMFHSSFERPCSDLDKIAFLVMWVFWIVAIMPGATFADETPDELYRQGRFAEAEQAYAEADLDNPRDLRSRYNRGCAAYQNGNFQGAVGAFSSVLRRTEDDALRSKATYNLGNAVYRQGDVAAAADYYKQAILLNPDNEDAKYNLELALRKLDEINNQSSNEPTEKKQQETEGNGKSGQEGQKSPDNQVGKNNDKKDKKKDGVRRPGDLEDEEKIDQNPLDESKGSKRETEGSRSEQRQAFEDFAGDLSPRQGLPDNRQDKSTESVAASSDKKKAEALLDNIKEDRSKFLRFQIPDEKRQGMPSGKDW